MAINSANVKDRENNKFVESPTRAGQTAVEVVANEVHPTTATVTSVNASITSVTLLSANTSRQAASITNDSNATLHVKLGSGASTTSFTVKLTKDQIYELPHPAYTGIITGIWSAASGAARITETT